MSSEESLMPVQAPVGSNTVSPPDRLAVYASLVTRLTRREQVDLDVSGLVDQAARVWSRPGFDVLLSRPTLRFEPFEHQVQAEALRVRTREVMVRHRRSEVALMLPQRLAETLLVTPSTGRGPVVRGSDRPDPA